MIFNTVPAARLVSLNNAGWPQDECSWLTVRYFWKVAKNGKKKEAETDELNTLFLAREYLWASFTDP